jgi:hypothetical protein
MTPSLREQLLSALVTLLLAVSVAVKAWVDAKKSAADKPNAINNAVVALTNLANIVVTELWQTTVAQLKDPTKPGAWDDDAKRSVARGAIARLTSLGAGPIRALSTMGMTPAAVDALLKSLIESEVVKLNISLAMAASAQIVAVDTTLLETSGGDDEDDSDSRVNTTGKHIS